MKQAITIIKLYFLHGFIIAFLKECPGLQNAYDAKVKVDLKKKKLIQCKSHKSVRTHKHTTVGSKQLMHETLKKKI